MDRKSRKLDLKKKKLKRSDKSKPSLVILKINGNIRVDNEYVK